MNDMTIAQLPLSMSSLEIAELTGKEHSNVLRDIRSMLTELYVTDDGSNVNHEEIQGVTVTKDARGYMARVDLDKDHTLTLLTGYDVKARMKVVKRWQELEALQPKTVGDILVAHAVAFRDNERRLAALEQQQQETRAQISALVDGANNFTVVGYANLIGVKITNQDASRLGKAASAICRDRGWPIGKVNDTHWGVVGAYPREAVAQAFESTGFVA